VLDKVLSLLFLRRARVTQQHVPSRTLSLRRASPQIAFLFSYAETIKAELRLAAVALCFDFCMACLRHAHQLQAESGLLFA
jgi:hypothetical protein